MSNYTPVFRLPYIYSKEAITEPMERIRYLTIDKQLESLFTFLGDGIITGWELTLNDEATSVFVSPGSGILLNMAIATVADVELNNLTSSSASDTVNYIYIESIYSTPSTAAGRLFATDSQEYTSQFLYLGKVTVGTNGKIKPITTADLADRKQLEVLRYLLESVSTHLHTGAPGQPDKIDLTNHVKGILSSANIQDLSASKVTSGTIAKERLSISHNDLKDIGTLTHPDIDSLIDKFQDVNKTLFGDLMTSNLLQLILSYKHVYGDCDDLMTNAFSVIPGVGNNSKDNLESFIDQNNTSAEIDYVNHRIQGKYVASREIGSVKMQTVSDFSYDGDGNSTYDDRYVSVTSQNDVTSVKLVSSSSSVVMHDKSVGNSYTVGEHETNWTGVDETIVEVLDPAKFLICSANRNKSFRSSLSTSNMSTFTVDEEVIEGVRDLAVNSGSLNLMFDSPIDMSTDNSLIFGFSQVNYIRNKLTRNIEYYSNYNYLQHFDEKWSPDVSLDLYIESTIGNNRYFYKYVGETPFLSVLDNSLFANPVVQATASVPARIEVTAGISEGNLTYVFGHAISGNILNEQTMTTAQINALVNLTEPSKSDVVKNITGLYLYSKNDVLTTQQYLFNVSVGESAAYDLYFPMGQRNTLALLNENDNPDNMNTQYSDLTKAYRESTMLVDIDKVSLGTIDFYRRDIDKNKVEDITIDFGNASVDFSSISWDATTVSDTIVYFQVKRLKTSNGEDPDIDYSVEKIYTNNISALANLIATDENFSSLSSAELLGPGSSFPVSFNHIIKLGIRVVLLPSSGCDATPILNSITVGYISNTVPGGVTVETASQWNNYRVKQNVNINTVGETYATMTLTSTTSQSAIGKIRNLIYGSYKKVVECSESSWTSVLTEFYGTNVLPKTVKQLVLGLSAGFSGYVTGIKKMKNGNVVILDQDSSRIIEMDQNYNNVLRIVSSEYAYKENPVGLKLIPSLKKVVYNGQLGDHGVLYLVFSHEMSTWIDNTSIDISKYDIADEIKNGNLDLTKLIITHKADSYDLSSCTVFPCDRGTLCVVLDKEIGQLIYNNPSLKLLAEYKANSADTENACVKFTATTVPYGIESVEIEKVAYNLIYAPIQGIVGFDIDEDDVWHIIKQAQPYSYDTTTIEPWYASMGAFAYWYGWNETSGLYSGNFTSVIPVSNFRNSTDSQWVPKFYLNDLFGYRGTVQKKDDYLLVVVSGLSNEKETIDHDGVLIFKKGSDGKYDGPTQINVGSTVYPMAARFDPHTYDSDNQIYGKIYIALSSLVSFSSVSANSQSRVVLYDDVSGIEESVWGLRDNGDYALNVNDVFPLEFNPHNIIVSV